MLCSRYITLITLYCVTTRKSLSNASFQLQCKIKKDNHINTKEIKKSLPRVSLEHPNGDHSH